MMNAVETKHTPGPWSVGAPPEKVITNYRDGRGNVTSANYTRNGAAKTIVTCEQRSWMSEGEHWHNARLIAAAPDLLAALQAAASSAGFQYMIAETRDLIDVALSKATGA